MLNLIESCSREALLPKQQKFVPRETKITIDNSFYFLCKSLLSNI